jgi:dinuclear metal center YbgI/SA1388 family protein
MAKITVQTLLRQLETRIPASLAESWDPVGLLVGSPKAVVRGVVTGVDLTHALLGEAVRKKANVIVIHHPPLFPKGKGLSRLVPGESGSREQLLLECYRLGIAVIVAHTNFDRGAIDGMVKLAQALGAEPTSRVLEFPKDGRSLMKKLITYIPVDHFERVRDALYLAGCGHLGQYDCCGFGVAGVGNFRPLKGASPFIGAVGELEEVEEIRLETLVVAGMEAVAIRALKEAHPYEEVAYDLVPLDPVQGMKGMVWGLGYGFVGKLESPVQFSEFVRRVKRVFQVKSFLTNQHTPQAVRSIAFTPGSGSAFVGAVQSLGVDVYITGEVGYHASLEAARNGLSVFELGHRESEHYFLKTIESWMKEWKLPVSLLDERTQRII